MKSLNRKSFFVKLRPVDCFPQRQHLTFFKIQQSRNLFGHPTHKRFKILAG